MTRFRWILPAAVLGCAQAWAAAPAAPAAHAPAAAASIGIDLAGVDRSAKPGDDFDAYANGTWREHAEIPADRSSTGVFYEVFKKAEQRTADLIRD
ncbi:MAG TPA: M13 family peptidase, partial [Mizugakiibacter sp.]